MNPAGARAAIVGVGHTEFSREIAGRSILQLRVEAALGAVVDAGLKVHDIDGVLIQEEPANPRYHMEFAEVLGLYDTPLCTSIAMGGSSVGFSVEMAQWALQSGRARYVLIVAGSKESSAGRSERGHGVTDRAAESTMFYPSYEHPYGPLIVSFYGLVAQRHMFEFGTTDEQIAAVSVAFRHNASLNPYAVYKKPITIEDVLASRMISTPLHMLECAIITDGAVAMVMTTAERAHDLRQRPVYVLGSGGATSGYWTGFLAKGGAESGHSLTRTLAVRAADDAFNAAGVKREDIDLVNLCDSFAIAPIVQLEDYGFCAKGEGGAFVGNGNRIRVDGDLPVNTHGGLLSCNHAPSNYFGYVEAVRQLRGQCGERQVKDAELAVAASMGGIISTHYVNILSVA
jgi:acetyl-CoA acetyltransferase